MKEKDIAAVIIDYRNKTIEVFEDNPLKGRTGGDYSPVDKPRKFALVSPWGHVLQGLRRVISNATSDYGEWNS